MFKKLFLILLAGIGCFVFVSSGRVNALTATNTILTARHVVDMSSTSPQYLDVSDLSPLTSVDNSTITSGLLTATINTSQANFIFRFGPAYNLPSDEEFKSIKLRMVYKMNVGTLSSHYVVVKYFNNSNVRTVCVSQHNLPIPSTQGTYVTEDIDLSSCQDLPKVNDVEVFYYASGSTLPVNTSFDQVVIYLEHGNKTSGGGSSSGSSTTSTFVKTIDVDRRGGTITREEGVMKFVFGWKSLPYEANIVTSKVFSPLVSKPSGLSGSIYKLDVFASFNGYPLVKFNPSLLFMSYPWCSGRPVIQTSIDGKNWKNLFTLRAINPANTAVAVITAPGYYAVTCQ